MVAQQEYQLGPEIKIVTVEERRVQTYRNGETVEIVDRWDKPLAEVGPHEKVVSEPETVRPIIINGLYT